MPGIYCIAILLAGFLFGGLAGLAFSKYSRAGAEAGRSSPAAQPGVPADPAELLALREERADLRSRLHGAERQLQAAQRELSSLLYSISHDLRAPLRSIDGFSQALIEDYGAVLDGTAHDYLRRVRASSNCMVELIEDILSISRISLAELRPERLDVSAIVTKLAGKLAAAHPDRLVEWDIAPDVRVHADRALLEIALAHLLENAWKFTAGKPLAQIRFRALAAVGGNGSEMVYEVSDNGAGFDMQFAGKLFGAFQKMHSPVEYPGKGIGLTAVQRIVHRHGGRVWAKASAGEGATFSFTLQAGEPELFVPATECLTRRLELSTREHPPVAVSNAL